MYFTSQDIRNRRERLREQWDALLQAGEAVLVLAGEPVQKPGGLDQHYPFLPHPAYFWLTGRRRESEVLLYSKDTGWLEFQKDIPPAEAIWEGERQDLLVNDAGRSLDSLDGFLAGQRFTQVHQLGAAAVQDDKARELRTALDQTRRKKDAAELALMRRLADIAAGGYEALRWLMRPGVTEKELQLAYEGEILRRGAHKVPYDSIVGSGPNAAVLHALPTGRVLGEGEFVLIDAGADIYDYCVDITRVFPSSPQVSSRHRDLYALVLKAETECIAMCRPGVWWHEVHLHAARVITEGLRDLGLLRGSLDALLEKDVAALFFPHGVGHLVGLRVRDTGQEEHTGSRRFAGANLRVDLPLEPDHTITVEPGCYFIPALLNDGAMRRQFADEVNWQEMEKWQGIGGVRIEDNIRITADGAENLTAAVPKVPWGA